MRVLTLLFALLQALATPPALAHDTAILPLHFRAMAGAPLTAQVSAGHGLQPLNGPRHRRLGHAALVGLRTVQRHRRWRHGRQRSLLGYPAVPAGPLLLALTTRLTFIAIDDDTTGHYLDEVQPPAAQRALWEAQRARGEAWQEWYAKDARTYLRASSGRDQGRGGRGWQRLASRSVRLKQRLELLPLNDPTRLRIGGALRVRLLLDGLPQPDVALRLFDRHGRERVQRTDAHGHARFVLPRRGAHLIATTLLQPPAAAGEPWRSRFGTLGFHVGRPVR